MSDQVFYLGEKKEKPKTEKPEEEKTNIRYGGAMPDFLENPEYRPRTEEEVERARLLSAKHERKAMIVRRLLYLEKRQSEILSYMMGSDHKHATREQTHNSVFFFYAGAVLLIVIVLSSFLNPDLGIGIFIPMIIVLVIAALYKRYEANRSANWREKEWEQELREMENEHRELSAEKAQLMTEIREMENPPEEDKEDSGTD